MYALLQSSMYTYRDNKGQTPYVVAPEKEIRNVFRKYMGENPDKYDYSKAQVCNLHCKCLLLF